MPARFTARRYSDSGAIRPHCRLLDYFCMIFGVNATKSAIVVVKTKGAGNTFAINIIFPAAQAAGRLVCVGDAEPDKREPQ